MTSACNTRVVGGGVPPNSMFEAVEQEEAQEISYNRRFPATVPTGMGDHSP